MNTLKSFAICSVIVLGAIADTAFAKTQTILADVSGSNRLIEIPAYAKAGGIKAKGEILSLQPGDWVQVRRVGERGADNLPAEKLRITRQRSAGEIGDMVAGYIASLPSKTPEGDSETNLIAALEFGEFDCANGGKILILSDGVEHSSYITGKDLLISGKPLPAPEANLKGCEVTIFGLGQSKDGQIPPKAIKNLKAAWAAWMSAAGVTKFTAIIDP